MVVPDVHTPTAKAWTSLSASTELPAALNCANRIEVFAVILDMPASASSTVAATSTKSTSVPTDCDAKLVDSGSTQGIALPAVLIWVTSAATSVITIGVPVDEITNVAPVLVCNARRLVISVDNTELGDKLFWAGSAVCTGARVRGLPLIYFARVRRMTSAVLPFLPRCE
eukprot:COSAG01_NODE_31438_length_597_cov_5.206827_1_plen_169_part_01